MALQSRLGHGDGLHCLFRRKALHGVVASAVKSGKGFGGARRQELPKLPHDATPKDNKQLFKEAATAVSGHRPVKPEEAARGKLDYVQVADWGDGDRSKLGELRLVSHVQQYEGGAAEGNGGSASVPACDVGPGGGRRPFHLQLAQQLKMAEARGALAVAGPPPPSLDEWSFREGRYRQYLADLLEVHSALEAALLAATATATTTISDSPQAEAGAALSPSPPPPPPSPAADVAGPHLALLHLAPGRLGLERSAAIRRDLEALRATATAAAATTATAEASWTTTSAAVATAAAGPSAAVVAGAAAGDHGGGKPGAAAAGVAAGPMARSYAQVLHRLGRVAAGAATEQERWSGALRLLAHTAVLHLVAQAVWVRVGAAATERLALLQRRAAATYHEYPPQVTDPRVTLSRALDAAGENLRSAAARQVVYDEVAGAMQKTGLLLSALAHRD